MQIIILNIITGPEIVNVYVISVTHLNIANHIIMIVNQYCDYIVCHIK